MTTVLPTICFSCRVINRAKIPVLVGTVLKKPEFLRPSQDAQKVSTVTTGGLSLTVAHTHSTREYPCRPNPQSCAQVVKTSIANNSPLRNTAVRLTTLRQTIKAGVFLEAGKGSNH